MQTLEIVWGNSCYQSFLHSDLGKNKVLKLNVALNIADLSGVDSGEIVIPESLRFERSSYYFQPELTVIREALACGDKVRVWTSHQYIYTQLLLLMLSNLAQENHGQLVAVYSDEFKPSYQSPGMMRPAELTALTQQEHLLTSDEIKTNARTWQNLVRTNSPLRIMDNGEIKSVAMDYYHGMILAKLRALGCCRVAKLVADLMFEEVYLTDNQYVFFIEQLLAAKAIKVVANNARFFDAKIAIVC